MLHYVPDNVLDYECVYLFMQYAFTRSFQELSESLAVNILFVCFALYRYIASLETVCPLSDQNLKQTKSQKKEK